MRTTNLDGLGILCPFSKPLPVRKASQFARQTPLTCPNKAEEFHHALALEGESNRFLL